MTGHLYRPKTVPTDPLMASKRGLLRGRGQTWGAESFGDLSGGGAARSALRGAQASAGERAGPAYAGLADVAGELPEHLQKMLLANRGAVPGL